MQARKNELRLRLNSHSAPYHQPPCASTRRRRRQKRRLADSRLTADHKRAPAHADIVDQLTEPAQLTLPANQWFRHVING